MHEVVVMNRLEQLRKKQRDEALQAQEELLAGVPRGMKGSEATVEQDDTHVAAAEDEVEPYDRSMSPAPMELSDLHPDDRQIETIDELSDRAALVSVNLNREAICLKRFRIVRAASCCHFVSLRTPCGSTGEQRRNSGQRS